MTALPWVTKPFIVSEHLRTVSAVVAYLVEVRDLDPKTMRFAVNDAIEALRAIAKRDRK